LIFKKTAIFSQSVGENRQNTITLTACSHCFLSRVLLTYISADFRDMEDMKGNFEDDFKSYNKLMEEVAKKPIVSKCCLMPERKSMLVSQIHFLKLKTYFSLVYPILPIFL
jgi:hypothetical protein